MCLISKDHRCEGHWPISSNSWLQFLWLLIFAHMHTYHNGTINLQKKEKLGVMAHTYNVSPLEAKAGVLHVWSQSWIHKESIILKGVLFLFPMWFHLCNANTQCVSVQTLNSAPLNSCKSVKIQTVRLGCTYQRKFIRSLRCFYSFVSSEICNRFIKQCCIESYNSTRGVCVCVHVLPWMWHRTQTSQCERLIGTIFKELSRTLESLKRVDATELCLRQKMQILIQWHVLFL